MSTTHPGIVKMKSLSRSYLWWPAIDKDLERKVNTCLECQSVRSFQANHNYRVTPHVTTGMPPWIRFDLLKSSLLDRVANKQEVQARGQDKIPKVELEQL